MPVTVEVWTRSDDERESDYAFIADKITEGRDYRQIFDLLNAARPYSLTYKTFCEDRKVVFDRFAERLSATAHGERVKELARIDKIETKAWESWYESQGETTSTSKTMSEGQAVMQVETQVRRGKRMVTVMRDKLIPIKNKSVTINTRSVVGAPEFLRIVQWCVETRCKILGLIRNDIRVLVEDSPRAKEEKEVFTSAIVIESTRPVAQLTDFQIVDENQTKKADDPGDFDEKK